jgi:hypothetical protein
MNSFTECLSNFVLILTTFLFIHFADDTFQNEKEWPTLQAPWVRHLNTWYSL